MDKITIRTRDKTDGWKDSDTQMTDRQKVTEGGQIETQTGRGSEGKDTFLMDNVPSGSFIFFQVFSSGNVRMGNCLGEQIM